METYLVANSDTKPRAESGRCYLLSQQEMVESSLASEPLDVTIQMLHVSISAHPDLHEHRKACVFYWVSKNPGVNARHVSEKFGISGKEAIQLSEELLNEGLLDFEE